jgi:hypothetical protein
MDARSRPVSLLCRRVGALGLGLALAADPGGAGIPDTPSTGGLTIEHASPGCVAAGQYARLTACFRPEGESARGRVYFRAQGTTDWFYVEMSGDPPCLDAVLPRPREDLVAVEYSIAGLARDLTETRTAEYTVPVTAGASCRSGPMAPVLEEAAVIIGSTSGSEPTGFLTGGGMGTGVILGVVGGAAAVTALVLLAADGEDERPAASWRSELAVPGGRGQVLIDGVPAGGADAGSQSLPLGPGLHRLEAVLVDGEGRPGSWLFDLDALRVLPGSLVVVAGTVQERGPRHVRFRLGGEPGERVALTFRLE